MPSLLTQSQVQDILQELGYSSLKDYQKINGLPETNQLDTATERHLLQIRYCNLPDTIVMDTRVPLAKWGIKKINWAFATYFQLRGFSRSDSVDVFKWVWQQWANVADLQFTYQGQPQSSTHIVIGSGRIDSAGNTLAWSELPPANRVNQKYDHDEPFVFSQNPPSGKIDLGATGVHEGGHALGISHAPPNIRNALMAPIYNPLIRTPQNWDIEQIQARYGAPVPITPPVTPPTNPPTPGQPEPESPFISGLDYTLKPGYICCAVPTSYIAPKYRPPS